METIDYIFSGIFVIGIIYLIFLTRRGNQPIRNDRRFAKRIGQRKWFDCPRRNRRF
jgi:hypothetical protein